MPTTSKKLEEQIVNGRSSVHPIAHSFGCHAFLVNNIIAV